MPDMKTWTANGVTYTLPFAPNGYGLGETFPSRTLTTMDEVDNCLVTGFYRYAVLGSNICGVGLNYGSLIVYTVYTNEAIQELRPLNTNYVMRRSNINGTWGDWEIENPPMNLGVEYRTTERRNGKPVYTIMLNAGAMTSVNDISVPVPGINEMLRFAMTLGDDVCTELNADAIGGNPANKFFCLPLRYNDKVGLYVVCGDAHVGKELIVQIWYIKG